MAVTVWKKKMNLQAQTLTHVVHILFFTRVQTSAQNPLWIQCVLGLSCSISIPSSQIIKGAIDVACSLYKG